jgi:hypothetical protein
LYAGAGESSRSDENGEECEGGGGETRIGADGLTYKNETGDPSLEGMKGKIVTDLG